jgi:hypothetical protein
MKKDVEYDFLKTVGEKETRCKPFNKKEER